MVLALTVLALEPGEVVGGAPVFVIDEEAAIRPAATLLYGIPGGGGGGVAWLAPVNEVSGVLSTEPSLNGKSLAATALVSM